MPFNEILDQIISLIMRLNHSNHIFVKQSGLNAVNYIGTVLSADIITDKILPTVILLSSDRCVNVRIVAAKTLNHLKNYVTPQGLNKIKLSLKPLLHDPDPDVQYFASHTEYLVHYKVISYAPTALTPSRNLALFVYITRSDCVSHYYLILSAPTRISSQSDCVLPHPYHTNLSPKGFSHITEP